MVDATKAAESSRAAIAKRQRLSATRGIQFPSAVAFRLSREQRNQLRLKCQRLGIKQAVLLRQAIETFLAMDDPPRAVDLG